MCVCVGVGVSKGIETKRQETERGEAEKNWGLYCTRNKHGVRACFNSHTHCAGAAKASVLSPSSPSAVCSGSPLKHNNQQLVCVCVCVCVWRDLKAITHKVIHVF